MYTIFSTREIVAAIWIVGLIILCFISAKIRKSLFAVAKIACTQKLAISVRILLAVQPLFLISRPAAIGFLCLNNTSVHIGGWWISKLDLPAVF